MKEWKTTWLVVGVVCVAVMFALMISVPTTQASIAGSGHDFSDTSWATNKICDPCHTPHNSASGGAPLWNHSNTTVASWTMYNNTNGTQNSTPPSEPSSESKACLSCHDGSINVNAYGGAIGDTKITAPYVIGTNGALSADHPISITYDTTLYTADGGLHHPTNATVAALLIGNRVECSSCHDVHNGSGLTNMLQVTMVDSALCLRCHDK